MKKKDTLPRIALYAPHRQGRVYMTPSQHDIRDANILAESSVTPPSKALQGLKLHCETPNIACNLR